MITPFTDYRDLLDQIIYEIKNEQSGPLRRAVIKAIGVLGALDPYEYKTIQMKEMQAAKVTPLNTYRGNVNHSFQ